MTRCTHEGGQWPGLSECADCGMDLRLPEQRLSELAADFAPDDSESFAAAVLRRRAWRMARSGKPCPHCERTLPTSAFGPDASKLDGLASRCRECRAEIARARRAA